MTACNLLPHALLLCFLHFLLGTAPAVLPYAPALSTFCPCLQVGSGRQLVCLVCHACLPYTYTKSIALS